ncbi:RNA polymerase sigma-70 factor (ECF subfamily) [Pedobacter sp. CAN_A7]|uniref:RNA polymerase sigma factor n=1 Tax=Pedobacter sp. CAN_A7 TaxID=2787722 RepID=UPI0018C9AE53
MQQQTDLELMAETLAGKTASYVLLVNRHKRFVFTMALKFVKNREDAEEVAQDCFVKAYKALGTFKQTSKFSTWLYTIAYTTAMSHLRKKRLPMDSIDEENSNVQLQNSISSYRADGVEFSSKYAYLNLAISQLLPDDAAIITLFYQGEQSLDEIADTLNMESNTVKVKLHRARIRLREKLQLLLKDEVKELL